MRILVIEDDTATSKNIQTLLKAEGFVTDTTEIGEDGLEIARHYDYDLIILDLMLPDIDGYEILRRLRTVQVKTPILILSGLSEIDDKIKGLGFGADDYLTKPFNKGELLARVRAIIRRSKGHPDSIIKIGRMTLDLNSQVVQIDDQLINLTGREYSILELLAIRKGATIPKEGFLNHLYGGLEEPEFKIIDVFVCKLRKKLQRVLGKNQYIKTVWGRGYVLRESSENEPSTSSTPTDPKFSQVQPEASRSKKLSRSTTPAFKSLQKKPQAIRSSGAC